MQKIFISCPYGLSGILNKELKKLNLIIDKTIDCGSFTQGELSDVYKINLCSRIANKVYINLGYGNCNNLDDIFEICKKINRSKYIPNGAKIVTNVQGKSETFKSSTTLQSIAQKAIYTKLTGSKTGKREINLDKTINVLIALDGTNVCFYIDTSGQPLYIRGYKTTSSIAPIKENIASGLIFLSGRHFKEELVDPFCGSGTIIIEAGLISKNIAPGLNRYFAFQDFKDFEQNEEKIFLKIKEQIQSQIYTSTNYKIKGYDIDGEILETTLANIEIAGLKDIIILDKSDFLKTDMEHYNHKTIITNPPYGKRIQTNKIDLLYKQLIKKIENPNTKGGFITNFDCPKLFSKNINRKKNILYNGQEKCNFWKKSN